MKPILTFDRERTAPECRSGGTIRREDALEEETRPDGLEVVVRTDLSPLCAQLVECDAVELALLQKAVNQSAHLLLGQRCARKVVTDLAPVDEALDGR
jgi:hypothetical protein